MLLELGLRNFKAFGDVEQKAPLSKITLIYGPNSGGKSSIIQALLMLKQSMNVESLRSATRPKLVLGGDYVDLGSFSALIHKHEQNRKLEIGIKTISKADSPWNIVRRQRSMRHDRYLRADFSWNVGIRLMAEKMPILSEVEYEFLSENKQLSFNAKCEYNKEKERWERTSCLLEARDAYKEPLPGKTIADAAKGLSFNETYGYLPLPVNESEIRRLRTKELRESGDIGEREKKSG